MPNINMKQAEDRYAAIKRLAATVPEAQSSTGRVVLSYFINWLIDRYAEEIGFDMEEAEKPGGDKVQSYKDEIARLKQEIADKDSE